MNEIKDNQRAQQVLKILVERYIKEGCPIGSKTIAEEYAIKLSPATIRNILCDLEEKGYISSPHTSAGRVPTERGYRLFVNSLLVVKPLEGEEVSILKDKLHPDFDTSRLVQSASDILSGVTQMMGIVSLPRHNRLELRHVEFLSLSGGRILVIMVLNNREVQNRIIYTDRVYSASELQQASNYLNTHFAGKDLSRARKELLESIQKDRHFMTDLLQATIDAADKAFTQEEERHSNYAMTGQNNLIKKESSVERIRTLFDAFTQKQDILNLLDSALQAEGVQIFIGKESGYEAFDDCSIVTAPYKVNGECIGSLGIIGPKRMPYDRVISAVDVTAKLLSAALNQE